MFAISDLDTVALYDFLCTDFVYMTSLLSELCSIGAYVVRSM